jgi:hypothetical protein
LPTIASWFASFPPPPEWRSLSEPIPKRSYVNISKRVLVIEGR